MNAHVSLGQVTELNPHEVAMKVTVKAVVYVKFLVLYL